MVGPFDALLVKVNVPFAVPELCGVNVTVNEALSPACNVSGNEIPLITNSPLFELPLEMVTLALVAFSFADNGELVPTTTLPKSQLPGVTLREPFASPVPLNPMLRLGFDPSEASERLPVALPADCGANITFKV